MDLNLAPKPNTPLWSESRWNGCFNPHEGIGVFIHAGRLRNHLEWWWVQTAVYLPDGQLAVDRSWVRDPDDDGLSTPTLDLRITEQGWTARFDGIAELTTTQRLTTAAAGSSGPSVPMTFQITARTTRPAWDLYAGGDGEHHFAGDKHFEQACETNGSVEIADAVHRLDGIGFYDHSAGARDWTIWDHHHFTFAIMPRFTINAIQALNADGTPARDPIGVWITDDERQLPLTQADMPELENLLGEPHAFDLTVGHQGNESVTLAVEILHTFPCQITDDNDNINGVDWTIGVDPLVLVECMARLTAPDGSVGYAHIERCARRSAMHPSTPAHADRQYTT